MGTMGMKLDELQENEKIHIEVTLQNGKLEYEVEVLLVEQGIVFIEPIRYNNQIINFMKPDINITVIYARNEKKPIEWRGCVMKSLEYKGNKYHAIACKNVGIEVNRRSSVRIFVGENGIAHMSGPLGAIQVTVKDVSASGFSYTASTGKGAATGESVKLVFEDHIHYNKFELYGTLVRIVEIDESRVQFGCALTKPDSKLEEYIALRQRSQARHIQQQLIERSKETYLKDKKSW